ncbi:MAG: type II toxin-antitoxin system VapC family toxin [Nitrososphaerales archaeon]
MARHLSKLPKGKSVFLDANIFHFYLRGPEELRKTCVSLLERIDKGENIGFTSSLVLDEVMYKILLKRIEDKHQKNPLSVIQKSFEEIGAQSPEVRKALNVIVGIQSLNVLSVERYHLEISVDYMEKYSVLPRDAIHLSVMKSIGCTDMASADGDFDRVSDINRWTPLIPA